MKIKNIASCMMAFTFILATNLMAYQPEESSSSSEEYYMGESMERELNSLVMDVENSAKDDSYTQERNVISPYYPIDYSAFNVASIGFQGTTVTLADGSNWAIRPNDGWIVQEWNDAYNSNGSGMSPSFIYVTTNNNLFWNKTYPFHYG